ncbi:MAG: DegT/DnrJ/EryC1/StrS family aminotransferase, partial [Betaproteobacteria bacterium]|nr:DegT/DnrJ/EryC1/StrS family aminotransferase [Betaproteobacteria bacterium]
NLGTIGELGCVSFHETKNLLSGEGGALLVNDGRFVARAEIIREKGTNRSRFLRGEVDKYSWVDIGSSYLPSELVAAFLEAQFVHSDAVIARRRAVWQRYYAGLGALAAAGLIELPRRNYGDREPNGHLFYVLTDTLATRSALAAHLRTQDILAVSHYVPLHSSPAGRTRGRTSGSMKVTDDISERLLRLPIYYSISDAEVDTVIDAVRGFFQARA